MLLAKIKGLAFGLAAAAVVTTGVGVLAQAPGPGTGPGPQEDRLGAVEQKLDRILHALRATVRGPRGPALGNRRGTSGRIPAPPPSPGARRADSLDPGVRARLRPPTASAGMMRGWR